MIGVTTIGLDPLTGLARRLRRRDHPIAIPAAIAARANPNPVGPAS
jgi:hypothetical protein